MFQLSLLDNQFPFQFANTDIKRDVFVSFEELCRLSCLLMRVSESVSHFTLVVLLFYPSYTPFTDTFTKTGILG